MHREIDLAASLVALFILATWGLVLVASSETLIATIRAL